MATEVTATPIKSKNTGTVAIIPSQKTQDLLIKYVQNVTGFLNNNWNLRQILLEKDLSYARERGRTKEGLRAEWSNRAGNSAKLRDVVIPVVMPQVESAVSFLSDIFLTGYPIFPVVSKPDQSDSAIQMETLVGEHSVKFGWVPNFSMAFRDGLKYNLMAVEVCWKDQKIWQISTDPTSTTAASKTVDTYYQGNYIKRISPYNIIIDTRVANPTELHKYAEFLGYTELFNRIQLMQLIQDLGATSTMNATKAYESGQAAYTSSINTDAYYIPEINPFNFDSPNQNSSGGLNSTNWLAWAGLEAKDGIKYANMYEVTTLYCRIIPNDFDLNTPNRNNIQIWKLIVVNRKVLIYCERQTNAHNYLPIIVGQPIEDGLGYQTKSFADNATPMQDAATSLYNSAIESQRRKVYDRIFYDPSKINKKDIDNTSAVARIPIKQVAYGQPLESAIYAMPYHDEGVSTVLQMAMQLSGLADKTNGQNPASQGQFQKGNRSRKEFETVMGNADGRMQSMALNMEYSFFQPIKEIIKLNILQFQPPTTLYNRNESVPVKINPIAIRQSALEFKLSDGVLPTDKMMNLDAIQEVLQMTASNPAIAQEYDVPGMIMYALTLQGAAWIQDFKRTPPQQVAVGQNMQANSGTTDANGNPIQPTAIPSATQPQPGTAAGA